MADFFLSKNDTNACTPAIITTNRENLHKTTANTIILMTNAGISNKIL